MVLSPALGSLSPLQQPLSSLQTLSASPLHLVSPLQAPAAVSAVPRVGLSARVTPRRAAVSALRYEPEKLFELFGKVSAAAARGDKPVVIFDLDDTLVSACHRHLRILREFADLGWVKAGYPEFVRRAGQAGLGDMRYRFTDTLHELGLWDPRALKSAYSFWRYRFFSDAYIAEDRAIAGAAAYVRELARRGAVIVYLTARIESRRGATEANLAANGFPAPDGGRVVLRLKPDHYGGGTGDYKREALEAVARLGTVVGGFDNEIANVNIFKRRLPGADIFMLDTRRPPAEEAPLPGLLWVRDYLLP